MFVGLVCTNRLWAMSRTLTRNSFHQAAGFAEMVYMRGHQGDAIEAYSYAPWAQGYIGVSSSSI